MEDEREGGREVGDDRRRRRKIMRSKEGTKEKENKIIVKQKHCNTMITPDITVTI